MPVTWILDKAGVGNVYVVPEQEQPDGNFPTCEYPNPENREALECAIALAEKVHPDLIIIDYLQLLVPLEENNEYVLVNYNIWKIQSVGI